ncbi:MAG: hypothetical protein A2171_01325 [Candidatus Levybacteria bacterium RBG_13_35_9]|nr:MAG: hypothetical protein A2171_01325 [Candidatus Levybacteria bacterium RBG_13_35_9]
MFEPYWYGDEGIYQTLGLGIDNGRVLYKEIFDNKPPLLYLLYGFLNSDQFLLRLSSLIFGVFSVALFFKLCQKILKNTNVSYVSTFIFALIFGLPVVEGNIANAENFMLLFNILAGLLVFKTTEDGNSAKKTKLLFLAGIILSFSFLFKIVGVFDFAAFFLFLFFVNFSKKFKDIFNLKNVFNELKTLVPLITAFLLPIIFIALYFIFNDSFSYFLKAAFSNNIGYVGYGNKLIMPQGLLLLKLLILFMGLLYVFAKRKSLGKERVFIYIWFFFSLFNAFFSGRPYTHYVLVVVPSFCLILGLLMLKNKYLKLDFFIFAISAFFLLTQFSYYVKTVFYYQNFIQFVAGQKNVYDYQRFFDGNTPNDYEIAGYINNHLGKNDNLFIWGNNAQVYKLTNKLPPGRYTVAYHITNYEDGYKNTEDGLKKENPKFIIIMPNVSVYPFSLLGYSQKININGINIYEKFSK